MLKKCRILIVLSIIFLMLFGFNSIVNADMGAKPSITIKLENIKTDNYLIDLLIYDETGEKYKSPLDYNGKNGEQYSTKTGYNNLQTITISQLETLHNINYDGWISESTRWGAYLLFADCSGNSEHEHNFSYFGTPDTYKVVIINNITGETKITDVIHREDFSSNVTIDVNTMSVVSKANNGFSNNVTIDVNTMNVISKANNGNSFSNIKNIAIALILTIAVEIIIALIMKIKNIKIIFIANLITNIILQLALMYIPLSYMITFAIMEILIFIAEYLIYSKFFNDISKNKIITYTLIANIISALLTFIIK